MKVNIWSDIRCPFCYIGKRKFENALNTFDYKDKVEVVWHSFELDPNLKTQPEINIYDFLADLKGISREQAEEMNNHVSKIAQETGLHFAIEKSVIANSFNAHRIIQLAKTKGWGGEAEEEMFKAYFSENKNIDDIETLMQISLKIGLDAKEVKNILSGNGFGEEVRKDESLAHSLGIRSVPFFIFNNKYAISGAQSSEVFLQALNKSWKEYETGINQ